MADSELDDLGPVDYLVVEFPPGASHFTGDMATELAKLINSETVRLLDLLILTKDENGQIEGMEIEDLDTLDELRRAETQLADLTCARGRSESRSCHETRHSRWRAPFGKQLAAPFASAARKSGGQLIANGAFRSKPILSALEADEITQGVRYATPTSPYARRGVIGAPVARTAAVVGTRPSSPMVLSGDMTDVKTEETTAKIAGMTVAIADEDIGREG